jgi:hypothetical protein
MFSHRIVHMEFVLDRVELGQISVRTRRFSRASSHFIIASCSSIVRQLVHGARLRPQYQYPFVVAVGGPNLCHLAAVTASHNTVLLVSGHFRLIQTASYRTYW